MTKRRASVAFAALSIAADRNTPLHRQLYDELRGAILAGRLAPGARLPSSRALASELQVSRNTVMEAFAQLFAEGYLEGRVGSGTYVACALPEDLLHVAPPDAVATRFPGRPRTLSNRGRVLAASRVTVRGRGSAPRPFRLGLPALAEFPWEIWARISARRWKHPPASLLGYGDPAGYGPLREAIAAHLRAARGVRCAPEQVIVTSGSQQALDLAARVLLDPGDAAWIEDPGYLGARGALLGAGARLIPVPVDGQGLDVEAGASLGPRAKLVYVTPSHQYPLGVTLSLGRRLALLEWASRHGAWVIEDDYNSEYRYASRPLASVQGLDRDGRVIYLGTFSKVMFPALRIGYIVAPPDLAEAFARARELNDHNGALMLHAILAEFILEGHFARHVRRMRALYQERQALLVKEARRELAGLIVIEPAESGMTLVGWLPPGVSDDEASRRADAHGVEAGSLSIFALRPLKRTGLVLGYAGVDERQIRDGVRGLALALQGLAQHPPREVTVASRPRLRRASGR